MLKSKVAIQAINTGTLPDDTIMVGEFYVKQWKIPKGQHVGLKFGAFRQHVKIIPVAKLNGIRISPSIAQKMGLLLESQSPLHLRIHFSAVTGTLALGPLIGVLISRDFEHIPEKPFGTITMFCKELVDACKSHGAHVFFFTPNHIGENVHTVQGWIYSGGWRQMIVPAPDIINNRLTTRKLENDPDVQHFIKETKRLYSTAVFNEKFLDKTEVFDALKKDPTLDRYLPESHYLNNFATFKSMCTKYNNVFLKPVRGSLGKGIIRLSHLEGESYLALHTTPTGSRRQIHPSLAKLYSSLAVKMKTAKFQIQQGLQLIEIQKRPVDFRALVQKNSLGKWVITSIVARTAGSQHFVSNLARGGSLSTVSAAVAKSNLGASINRLSASGQLRQAALTIANGIDTNIPAQFGELGIDLAIDTNGKVWLLEVNSKPSKNDNTPLNEGKIRPSVRMMIQYARFLSGF
ncbi:YheC/YheD family protein [Paenibacillus sp. GSMTC-2017]|uniref:YheC/YheD family endospore coat-associated protein n=1 Tax=Paenibacillus sp. GSMTC-2017 TaxID=2794350 RepID=UPI0018D75006|nr:YheC/YheD family protein [Paenibacillus sp. GSMTC-2017]MBH5317249.1 YheC/YheD family protein [Paenibacillus sp. GSMTC-2017]